MLLERLVSYAQEHRGGVPAFHRERSFRWKLQLTFNKGAVTGAVLSQLKDPNNPKRGVVHVVPASTRTAGASPNLAADDAQYVLGWGDEDTKPERVAQCHEAFVELIHAWADAVPEPQDPTPHLLKIALRSSAWSELERPEDLRAKDGVVIFMDGGYAHQAPSAAEFWQARVGEKKGSGRRDVCMVCTNTAPLANTIPGKVTSTLVPGTSNDVALVSINKRVFGYDLAAQLTHIPVCLECADDVMVGLTGVLSSGHSRAYSEQDTRLTWWVADCEELDHMGLVFEPTESEVDKLFEAMESGQGLSARLGGRFCWLAVGGNVSRIMIREWADIALTCGDADLVSHDTNIVSWFRDHKNTPRRTEPVMLRGGTEIPAGRWFHSPAAFAACLGRWDPATDRYRTFGAKNADRPDQAMHALLRVAVLNKPVPVAMRAHLIHRIRNDGHIDDMRAALVRLALSRCPQQRKDPPIPMSLDETYDDPAYLAGRVFAILDDIQRAAHRRLSPDPDGDGAYSTSAQVNSTFSDRFFRRAVDTPRPVLAKGREQAAAWLTKIRRRDTEALANWHENRLNTIYNLVKGPEGLPLRNNLRQKEQFILGYHHQRAHRPAKAESASDLS